MLICGAEMKNGKVCGGKQLIFKRVILKIPVMGEIFLTMIYEPLI